MTTYLLIHFLCSIISLFIIAHLEEKIGIRYLIRSLDIFDLILVILFGPILLLIVLIHNLETVLWRKK